MYFEVGVEIVGDHVRFSTSWSLFVESWKIISSDFGLFVLSAPHTFEMKLFDKYGNEKPLSARPPIWNLFVAYGEEEPQHNPHAPEDNMNNYAGKV